MGVGTTARSSGAGAPIMAKRKVRSPPASTSAFVKPRVSDIVRDRNTATIGSFATRTAMPWRWASPSLKPTRASGGAGDMQYGTSRSRFVRFPPLRLAEMIRKSHHARSEEHTSELQSPDHIVLRLLLVKKKKH